jgi:hypothetical protein
MATESALEFSYTYQALEDPSISIRLLSVESASPGKIECSLRHVDNLELETYHCLSYTWDDPFGRDLEALELPVICDGRQFAVRKNLYDALLSIYAVQREKTTAIWVDAICINQDDEREKESQLGLMHKIYAEAKSVIIWLGPQGEDDSSILKFKKIAQMLRDQDLSGWDRMNAMTDEETSNLIHLFSGASIDAETWRAVEDLTVRRSYWSRLWIWQEIVAAKEDPVVVCGHHVLSWKDMRDVSHAWIQLGTATMIQQNLPTTYRPPLGMLETSHPYQLAFWRDSYREPQNGPSWIRWRFGTLVLELNRNSYVCSDERDKIYAHVGICGYDKLKDWDYKRPFCLRDVNLLTFIEDPAARNNRPKMSYDFRGEYVPPLPSWVPDLRVSLLPRSMWSAYIDDKSFNISNGLAEQGEQTGSGLTTCFAVDRDLSRLMLHGYLFDTIRQFGESQEELDRQHSIPGMLELIITLLEESTTPYNSPEDIFDALWSAISIMGPCPHGLFPVPQDQKKCAQDWLLHTILVRSKTDHVQNDSTQKQDHLREQLHEILGRYKGLDTEEYFPSRATCKEFIDANRDFVPGGDLALCRRRLFRSRDNWIGKGPQSMQVGDGIWIVPGATVAFILRGEGTRGYVYIGHAYVHGIMQGEACARFKGLKPEKIVLV